MRLAFLPGPRKLKLWHAPWEVTLDLGSREGPLLIKLHGPKRLLPESSQETRPQELTLHIREEAWLEFQPGGQ